MKTSNLIVLITGIFIFGSTSSCGVYSFSGVATSAQTITINNFYNDALGGPPDLNQRFTNALQDYFLQNTSLTLVPSGGDIIIEGSISQYTLTPLGAAQERVNNQQVDVAADTKLSITVKVSYVNQKDEQFNFESKSFTQFEPFSNEQNFTAIEDRLLEEIFEKLNIDIFNSTVANW